VNHLLALNPKNLDAGANGADGFTRAASDAAHANGGGTLSSSSNGMNVLHHAISQDNAARPHLQAFQEWVHSAVHDVL